MKVETSLAFDEQLALLSHADRIKIVLFVQQVQQHGLHGLQGRNKSSIPTNPHTKKERANFDYAQKYCLWHYHIGIPNYVGEFGDMTSEYILHYQRFDDKIVLASISSHPPFELPSIDKLSF